MHSFNHRPTGPNYDPLDCFCYVLRAEWEIYRREMHEENFGALPFARGCSLGLGQRAVVYEVTEIVARVEARITGGENVLQGHGDLPVKTKAEIGKPQVPSS
jgi:hypothetical protein